MTLLGGSTMGFVMLRDLLRCDQSTRPPATAIIMLPIAQLILGNVAIVSERVCCGI
jgi:hypothetical protein